MLPWLGAGLLLTLIPSFNKHLVDTCWMPAADLGLNGNGTMVVGIGHLPGRQDMADGPKLRTVLDLLGPTVTFGVVGRK